MKGENTKLKLVNCEWFVRRDAWTSKSFIPYSWFSTNFFVKIDGKLQLKKFYTEASVPSNELVFKISPKGPKVVHWYVLNDQACESRRLFRLLFHPPRKERLRSQAGKQFPWIIHNSALLFVELTSVGSLWRSRVQWPTVTMTKLLNLKE